MKYLVTYVQSRITLLVSLALHLSITVVVQQGKFHCQATHYRHAGSGHSALPHRTDAEIILVKLHRTLDRWQKLFNFLC